MDEKGRNALPIWRIWGMKLHPSVLIVRKDNFTLGWYSSLFMRDPPHFLYHRRQKCHSSMPLWTERADLWPHFWRESILLLAIKSDYACLNLLQVFILTHEMNNKILFISRKLQSSENAVTERLAAKAINVKQLTWSIHVVLASSFLIILSWWINLSLRGPSPFICVVGLTLG